MQDDNDYRPSYLPQNYQNPQNPQYQNSIPPRRPSPNPYGQQPAADRYDQSLYPHQNAGSALRSQDAPDARNAIGSSSRAAAYSTSRLFGTHDGGVSTTSQRQHSNAYYDGDPRMSPDLSRHIDEPQFGFYEQHLSPDQDYVPQRIDPAFSHEQPTFPETSNPASHSSRPSPSALTVHVKMEGASSVSQDRESYARRRPAFERLSRDVTIAEAVTDSRQAPAEGCLSCESVVQQRDEYLVRALRAESKAAKAELKAAKAQSELADFKESMAKYVHVGDIASLLSQPSDSRLDPGQASSCLVAPDPHRNVGREGAATSGFSTGLRAPRSILPVSSVPQTTLSDQTSDRINTDSAHDVRNQSSATVPRRDTVLHRAGRNPTSHMAPTSIARKDPASGAAMLTGIPPQTSNDDNGGFILIDSDIEEVAAETPSPEEQTDTLDHHRTSRRLPQRKRSTASDGANSASPRPIDTSNGQSMVSPSMDDHEALQLPTATKRKSSDQPQRIVKKARRTIDGVLASLEVIDKHGQVMPATSLPQNLKESFRPHLERFTSTEAGFKSLEATVRSAACAQMKLRKIVHNPLDVLPSTHACADCTANSRLCIHKQKNSGMGCIVPRSKQSRGNAIWDESAFWFDSTSS